MTNRAALSSLYKEIGCQKAGNLSQKAGNLKRRKSFGLLTPDILALPSKVLNPVGKLILLAYATESRGTDLAISLTEGQVAERIGASRQTVNATMPLVLKTNLLVPCGEAVNRVQAYKLNHWAFQPSAERPAEAPGQKPPIPMFHCSKCDRSVRRLGKTGWCSSCVAELDLQRKIDGALVELGPNATPEQLAAHLKNYRLITKIRRMRSAIA